MRSEPALAYKAFMVYRDERDFQKAYNNFMLHNNDALTSLKTFTGWASKWDWQRRVNGYDAQQELFDQRETRMLGRKNAFTSETIAEELYTCCMEEMRLKQGDMTHKDIAKYMEICQKIGDRWVKQPDVSPVTVNVEQNVNTVDIPDDVLKALGKKLVEEGVDNDST